MVTEGRGQREGICVKQTYQLAFKVQHVHEATWIWILCSEMIIGGFHVAGFWCVFWVFFEFFFGGFLVVFIEVAIQFFC